MGKSIFYSVICAFCFFSFVTAVPSNADISRDINASLKSNPSPQVSADNLLIASAETLKDGNPPSAAFDLKEKISDSDAIQHLNEKDSTLITAVNQVNQYAVEQSNSNAQTQISLSPLGISYKSNETAAKAVDRSISLFSDRIKKNFTVWLERSARYIEIMSDILKERNVPQDLVFLPIVESGFNPNANSHANAVGAWQFIAATAKRYGLVIDWWRDERKDPIKSTHAAARYLGDLYGMFGSWKLALAAYNAGEGRIGRALKNANTNDFWHLKERQKIPKETQQYVPHYIAAAMIANDPEKYGFYNLAYHKPLQYDEVKLYSPMDIDIIARCAMVSIQEIKGLNPELRRWSTPPNISPYIIKIPLGTKEVFLENLNRIPEAERFSIDTYRVKKGDTLKGLAKKAGFPLGVILALNSMGPNEALASGKVIKLPPKDKFHPDLGDKLSAKKVSYKKQTSSIKQSANKKGNVKGKVKKI